MNNVTLNPGKLYLLVSYEGHDPGTSYRFTTSFKPNQKPKKTSKKVTVPKAILKKIKRAKNKKSLTISVKNAKGVSGYEYAYATKKNFKGARIVRSKKTSVTLKKLNAKKKYYVRVRCYKKSGKKHDYGSYSSVKKA